MKALVSCIITTHNRAELLKKAMASVMAQTYPHLEIIIVDDGSKDHTEEVCRAWLKQDQRIHYIQVPYAQGANHARNLGIQRANGKYIAFLDDDDQWLPDKIQAQTQTLEQNKGLFCFCSKVLVYVDREDNVTRRKVSVESRELVFYEDLLTYNWIGETSKIMVQTQLARTVMFDEQLTSAQDYDFYLRILQRGHHAINVKEPLVHIYIHPGPRISTSAKKKFQGQRRVLIKYYKDMSQEQKKRQLHHYRMMEWSKNPNRNTLFLKKTLTLYPWWRNFTLLKRNVRTILLGFRLRRQLRSETLNKEYKGTA
ncbi:glycosyltransferase family 2 protein [Paenibacillus sp. MER 99-2]|uniref:glycosyltransferase family 2 protein n=1 Tax=Paenibacillus sp. MER 99-2 TaxID=2939572 RepID=UPI00203E4D14|nr:glycosyltransferase family 2 protein [Paenibacillus sp. MER 99-2]MCM3174502.1 glycosyltransferase family 2 protein [Paenibacillus sp. MER 99-2]